jgi:hypothetical protein
VAKLFFLTNIFYIFRLIDDFLGTFEPPDEEDYDPVLITTSNIFSAKQINFVSRHLASLSVVHSWMEDEKVFSDKILLELVINGFGKSYSMMPKEALCAILAQEGTKKQFCVIK